MNFKSIRQFLGIKTYMERYIENRDISDIKVQEITDKIVAKKLELMALEKYNDWLEDQEIISKLDKTKPYWQFKIPLRIEKMVCDIYYIDHYETAKYKNTSWKDLVNKRVEELKISNGQTTKI